MEKTDAEKAEMYRKQLGGTNAALNRSRQEAKALKKRVGELEELVVYMFGEVLNDVQLVEDVVKDGEHVEVITFTPPWAKEYIEPIRDRIAAAGIEVPEIEYRWIER